MPVAELLRYLHADEVTGQLAPRPREAVHRNSRLRSTARKAALQVRPGDKACQEIFQRGSRNQDRPQALAARRRLPVAIHLQLEHQLHETVARKVARSGLIHDTSMAGPQHRRGRGMYVAISC